MDFWGAVQLVRRRWYFVIAALVLSVGIAALTFSTITTTYESSGVSVLTAPANGASFSQNTKPEDVKRINPLLAFDGSLTTSAEILRQVLRDPETMAKLGAGSGSKTTYDVTNGDATTSGPFLFVVADGNSAKASQDMVAAVLDRTLKELTDRQRAVDAPQATFIQSNVLVKPTMAEAKINGKLRYAGAVFVLALIASFVGTFALDNILTSRRRRDGDMLDPMDVDGVPAQSRADGPGPIAPAVPRSAMRPGEPVDGRPRAVIDLVGPAGATEAGPVPPPTRSRRRPSPTPIRVDPSSETIQMQGLDPNCPSVSTNNGSSGSPSDHPS